jgi:hypothetical protein
MCLCGMMLCCQGVGQHLGGPGIVLFGRLSGALDVHLPPCTTHVCEQLGTHHPGQAFQVWSTCNKKGFHAYKATHQSYHDLVAFETLDVSCVWTVEWHCLSESAEPLAHVIPASQCIKQLRVGRAEFFNPALANQRSRRAVNVGTSGADIAASSDCVDEAVENIDPDDAIEDDVDPDDGHDPDTHDHSDAHTGDAVDADTAQVAIPFITVR